MTENKPIFEPCEGCHSSPEDCEGTKNCKVAIGKIKEYGLANLVKGMDLSDAPVKTMRHGKHYEFLIGIGNDHTAFITMDKEAYEALTT